MSGPHLSVAGPSQILLGSLLFHFNAVFRIPLPSACVLRFATPSTPRAKGDVVLCSQELHPIAKLRSDGSSSSGYDPPIRRMRFFGFNLGDSHGPVQRRFIDRHSQGQSSHLRRR
ncbi:hypothetical protein NL676_039347 [Syzygium grande]|nr:hypothetical protein NL676_039347 [Syzygium grande]